MAKQQNIIEILITAVDKAAPGLRSATQGVANFTAKFPLLGGLAVMAGAKVLGAFKGMADSIRLAYDETVRMGAAMHDTSLRTRVSAEELSGWKYALEMVGGSLESFESNLVRMQRQMLAATTDTGGRAALAFKTLGVEIATTDGRMRRMTDVMFDIAGSLEFASEGSKKFAAAQEVAGRGVSALTGLFREGPEQMRAYFAEAERVSGIMDTEFVAGCDAAEDALVRLRATEQGFKNDMTRVANPLVTWWRDARTEMLLYFREHASNYRDMNYTPKQYVRASQQKLDEEDKRTAEADAERNVREELVRLQEYAKRVGAEISEPVLDTETLTWIDVPLAAEKLRESIGKAIDEQKKRAKEYQKKLSDALEKDMVLQVRIRAKIGKITPPRFREPKPAAWWGDNDPTNAPPKDDEGDEIDRLTAKKKKWNEQLAKEADIVRQTQSAYASFKDELNGGMQQALSGMFSAMMTGQNSMQAFANIIKSVMIQAISDLIAKLIMVQILKAAVGMGGATTTGAPPVRAEGGRVPLMAEGGRISMARTLSAIPQAAHGMTIRGGRPGMDSVLFNGMPGEEIVDRATSIRLRRFLSSYESGGAVSPHALRAGGTRSNIAINFNVGRPVSTIDELTYGRVAVKAAKRAQEARM